MNIGPQVLVVPQNSTMGASQSTFSADPCQSNAGNVSTDSQPFAELLNSFTSALGDKSSGTNGSQNLSAASNPANPGLSAQEIIKILQQTAQKASQAFQRAPGLSQDKSQLSSSEAVDYSSLLPTILGSLHATTTPSDLTAASSGVPTDGNGSTSSDIVKVEAEIALLLGSSPSSASPRSADESAGGTMPSNINSALSNLMASDPSAQKIIKILQSIFGGQGSQASPQGSNSGGDETQLHTSRNAFDLTGMPSATIVDHPSLVPVIFGTLQSSNEIDTNDTALRDSTSVGDSSKPASSDVMDRGLYAKVKQELALLLGDTTSSTSPNSIDGSQTVQNNTITAFAKQAANDPAVKADLLRLLSNAPNSSQNVDFRAEVEKLLSEVPDLEPGPGTSVSQMNISSRPSSFRPSGTPQVLPDVSSLGKNLNDVILQNLQTVKAIGTNSDASAGKIFSTVIGTVIKGPTIVAAASQPVVNSTVQKSETSDDLESPNVNKSDNTAATPNASVASTSSVSDKQDSSTKNATEKSGDGTAVTDKSGHSITELYANTMADGTSSKVETFKQTLSSLTDSNNVPDDATTKPDASQVAQTIVREVKMMTQENKTVVNVKLEPESLGSVVLRVSSEDGKISASFNVRTSDAKAYLEASVPQMKQMLEGNGVSLSHLSVSLSTGDSQTKRQQYQSKKNLQRFSLDAYSDSGESARSFGYNTMEVKI